MEQMAENSNQSLVEQSSELSLRPQDSFPAVKSLDNNGATPLPEREMSACSEIEPAASSSEPGPSTPPTAALKTSLHTTTPEEEMFHQQLEEQFRHAAETRQELASHKSQTKFKIHDLLRNPELAAAAWQEMAGADDSDDEYMTSAQAVAALSVPSTPGKSKGGTEAATGTQTPVEAPSGARGAVGKCAAELMRDRSTLDGILADANAEFKINSDISRLLISRLKAGRQALEAQHTFIVQLVDAETAAVNVLRDAAVPTLHCEGDPGPLYSVAATAAAIPAALCEPRRAAVERLSALGKEIGAMVTKFRSAGEALSRACGALDWMADKKRSLVTRAFATHEVACEEADRTDELLRKGMPHNGIDADPWGTQAVLSASESGLLVSQQTQRGVVSDANEQVARLERSRVAMWQRLVAALLQTYGSEGVLEHLRAHRLEPVVQLSGLHEGVPWDSLMDPMARAVAEGRRTATNMQNQAQETAKSLAHDLFSSAEIVRQGPLDRWNSSTSSWVPYHAVLTRRGMLHVCRAATIEGCIPVDSVPLRLMEFDGASGSVFSMLRQQSMFAWLAGRPTKVVLRANNESTASLWMMDLKEQIATWSQRDVKSPVRRARSVDLL